MDAALQSLLARAYVAYPFARLELWRHAADRMLATLNECLPAEHQLACRWSEYEGRYQSNIARISEGRELGWLFPEIASLECDEDRAAVDLAKLVLFAMLDGVTYVHGKHLRSRLSVGMEVLDDRELYDELIEFATVAGYAASNELEEKRLLGLTFAVLGPGRGSLTSWDWTRMFQRKVLPDGAHWGRLQVRFTKRRLEFLIDKVPLSSALDAWMARTATQWTGVVAAREAFRWLERAGHETPLESTDERGAKY